MRSCVCRLFVWESECVRPLAHDSICVCVCAFMHAPVCVFICVRACVGAGGHACLGFLCQSLFTSLHKCVCGCMCGRSECVRSNEYTG